MIRLRTRFVFTLMFAVAVVAVGCGDDEPPVQNQAAQPATPPPPPGPKQAPTQATEAAGEDTDSTPLAHEVVVKRFRPERDPFKSVFETQSRVQTEITHPLQQYAIQQLKLLGIIWGIESPVALVLSPDGEEYIIEVGTPVGTGDGKVVAVLKDRVVIVERYYDYRGQLQTEKYELHLPKEGE